MSNRPDPDLAIAAWLSDEARDGASDRLLAATRQQIESTRQRPAWWPARRFRNMSNPIRVAIAAAALVVAAVVGVSLLPRTGGVAAPAPTPTPVPTASPSPTPTPIQMPSSGALAPGNYRSDKIAFAVPAGWTSFQGWAALKGESNPPGGMAISPWHIKAVFMDPCHWSGTTAVPVGPTVDDLVNALAAQPRGVTATPTEIIVDGYRGKQIDLMVPADLDFADCDEGAYHSWLDVDGGLRYNQGPGQHDLVYSLDINGSRYEISAGYFPGTSSADRAELQAILDSIQILP